MGHLKVSAAILTARQSLGYFHGEGGGGAGVGGLGGVLGLQHKTHMAFPKKKKGKK